MAKIAMLLANEFEDSEASVPMKRLEEAGHQVEVLGIKAGEEVSGKQGKETLRIDAKVSDRQPDAYDALLIPGGHSPDNLRIDEATVKFVKKFAELKRPIAAVCHGPQLLIEADVVKGHRMTSWPSVRTDLRNAGADVVDEEVVEDGNFITSRKPDDLEAFSAALIKQLKSTSQQARAS